MQGNPLAETDRPYRLLVEAVVDYALYLIDLDGRIASWNPGARRLKGYEAGEVIGQHYSLFFTEEDRRLGRPEMALETARRHGRRSEARAMLRLAEGDQAAALICPASVLPL